MAAQTRRPRRKRRTQQVAAATGAGKKRAAKKLALKKGRSKALTNKTAAKTSQMKPARSKPSHAKIRRQPSLVATALAAFAHEVRTPLTGILAISDMLTTSDLPERERHWVATIKEGAEHLASLATLFVDSAQGESSARSLRHEPFDLRALAQAAGDSLVARATAKGLRSEVTIDSRVPQVALGDAVRLRAALENLIDNAVKFTESGSVALDAQIVATSARQITLRCTVSDSGIGLSLTEIRKLFRAFSQANLGIAARFGGAGLGLWSVRQIARSMGGDIAVAARKGGGSAFTMTVKLDRAKSGTAAAEHTRPLRILCVEDNPFGRVVFKAVLTELGHSIVFTERGAQAHALVADGDFDAVLMDMVLPDITGVAAIRNIRALKPPLGRIPIIGVSGRERDAEAATKAGADAFAVKPVTPRELASLLSLVAGRDR